MFRIVAVAAALAVGACATKPITSDEFVTHGRFKADQCEESAPKPTAKAQPRAKPAAAKNAQFSSDGLVDAGRPDAMPPDQWRCHQEARERAFAECRAQAIRDFNQASNSQRGAFSAALAGYVAGRDSIQGCMDARGYLWTTPR